MPEDERRRERRGLFGRKKKRGGADESHNTDGDSTATGSVGGGERRKKTKGFGRQIRRLVGGRKKSKHAGDDVSTVEVFEKDDSNYRGPRNGLDPDMLAQVLSTDEPNSGEGPHLARGRFGSIDEGEEEEEEEDADSENEDMMFGSEKDDEASDRGELVGPLEIVLVLVDPQSLRFELLQLEFETPQLSKVSECLEQVKDIVTESALKSLEFHSVLDRQGNCFPAKVSLGKALTCRRHGKDILVGISKGISPDQAGRLARPILGDAKVIQMVRRNPDCAAFAVSVVSCMYSLMIIPFLLTSSK